MTADTRRSSRILLLLVVASLLPHLRAALPGLSYYFRDFTVTFYPLRHLWATELAAGRFPLWNPYVSEGAFLLPTLYPVDLLHALFPGPASVSWLLTLHFPLAAAAAYLLARDLGAEREGAFVSGVVYSMGGLALSALNLYVFLQALALAPLVVLGLRRAALSGRRWIAAAGVIVAVALSTLALEFVAQAIVLGLALALAEESPRARVAGRLAGALAIAAGFAAVPLALTADALRHSVRGSGFPREIALGNELHPAVLLQVLLPGVLGSLRAPVEEWWGGRFYTKGFPYFLSLYLGPCALGVAAAGWCGPERRRRIVLAAAGLLGLWYALGTRGGLALAVSYLPPVQWFRFPSKALLLPYLAVAIFAGFGADRLRRGGGWRALAVVSLAAAAVAGMVAAAPWIAPDLPARALAITREAGARAGRSVSMDALAVAGVSVLLAALSFLVLKRRLAPARAALVLTVLVVADLARAGMGMNPQVTPGFYTLLPEMQALRLDALSGGRVFSYGLDASPVFRRFLASGTPGLGLWSFFLSRQALAPYANVIDRVELAEGKDLTAFVPRAAELAAEEYDPARVGEILARLRSAAVTRVVSLDRLSHPDLELIAEIPAGPPAVVLRVYALAGSWPRAFVACRVVAATGAEDAGRRALTPEVRPDADVALEAPVPAGCASGSVTTVSSVPGAEEYDVESDGLAVLVTRDSFAPGWTATVDGGEADVVRANGKHRAVAVAAGRHRVRLRYAPPVLPPALWATVAAAAAAAFIAVRAKHNEYHSRLMAALLDGTAIARALREEAAVDAAALRDQGVVPGLGVVVAGDDPASAVYVRNKTRACTEAGLHHETITLPGEATTADVVRVVEGLNRRRDIHGILVQLPLPSGVETAAILDRVDPQKDVDGFHAENVGLLVQKRPRFVPCTPAGIMEMLQRSGIAVAGRRAVVLGRSEIVGKPMALLLLHADATVTVCHSRTADLASVTREADILIAAIGRPGFVRAEHVGRGAVVVDVGINRIDSRAAAVELLDAGRLRAFDAKGYAVVGDVHQPSVESVASALSPVPGGVGPLTIAMLVRNTVRAARLTL